MKNNEQFTKMNYLYLELFDITLMKQKIYHKNQKLCNMTTPSEFRVLKDIYLNPGTNLTLIASRINLTKGAVSQTIKQLLNKGLLIRERNETNHSNKRLIASSTANVLIESNENDFVNQSLSNIELKDYESAIVHKFLRYLNKKLRQESKY